MASQLEDGPVTSGFEDIRLINDSLPELNLDEIDLSLNFLGKDLQYPLMVNALTGGTDQALNINRSLARMALKYGLPMAVGSQSVALEFPEATMSFSIVREVNPNGIILANLNAAAGVKEALQAVRMISADALQLHFNVVQELAMAEGDRNFKGIRENIRQIVKECPVPVIAKEVGFGFSREAANSLMEAGIEIFDCSGQGGTNFILIEDQRGGHFAGELNSWGIPTAISLIELLQLPTRRVIASGGIRSAADAAKALALGADLVGMAAPLLKTFLSGGLEALDQSLSGFFYRLKAVFLMSGARNLHEIRQKPLIILREIAEYLRLRGIDPSYWARR
ncbi:MAG: type 2 isopentenyl-diphosphate Delta-isomerase [Syntrophomonas sp.]|uniref:type 2 isopentenyl-diphosphate Delta-isomerase n=1 Tax=Syntrophomonas sp. TaxID=2053627 RepID=UPI00262A95EF|nr:type 2 isopentenyl-diphosphate Delta-isomerase [Syntrophomonas sp.]MDD2511529.1 type 2 isopentenyl-diphosphate Delta-isomerase [Syntrophomonas sp.]MDD4627314.1 type 2 isopentenyl-diphosphate Delta-isomerase [Syntrophomonas sp.]